MEEISRWLIDIHLIGYRKEVVETADLNGLEQLQ